ncbi:autotransporter outer membrane beta-barrel domain-containing protein [Vibrio sp. 10N.261.46.E12]|uniref:autotransporter family protein n=1 Tax=unclassified Vibrio TaxID=2614977 RepID=UPI0009786AC1|nr:MULTISPECIES: autotransporter outer membrane beta-barrel domain-containing protein [unclassified Vibrio]OMO35584.1 hypothetical protein BH584_07935 [Vibrio sp. 10N.261.45.E1]PMJ23478.1 hypothetical protein BCU27_01810 [Vibrio sp. 10N.286.45.B6]PML87466.1 hypothetical protein BCT66_11845 [Vibrio sp. 10N.261.49.E11]PMM73817.1 hypothetical protein BCT48_04185 [Vibrio sp. 10N.261.46.F12]PMM87240.1 hypothetical protein BCT46_06495 [Vibrio sp. 10N.261.46.E8]
MEKLKLSPLASALGLALTFNQAQAATLDMDDSSAVTEDKLYQITKATGIAIELSAQGKSTDYDGVRYFYRNNGFNRFYINIPDVDSSELQAFQAIKNFYVEGNNANTDVFLLTALAESQDPRNPNPTKDRYEYIFDTLNLDNIHLQVKDQNSSSEFFGQPDLIIYDAINLNSSRLTFGKERQLFWRDDHAINVTGTGNVINVGSGVWDSPQTFSTSLNIADNSDLRLEDNSVIYNEFNGNLMMGPGSTLNIDRSQIVLVSAPSNPKFIASTINNATINLSGTFVTTGSSLYLTDPTITDSTINLANNTVFRSFRRDVVTGSKDPGIVTFEGNTTLNLGDRALFTGQAEDAASTDSSGTFYFNNGTTTVNGKENSEFKASDWVIDNATVRFLGETQAEEFVNGGLTIEDSTYIGRGFPFNELSDLSLTNSTVSGPVNFGNDKSTIWVGNNFRLDPGLRAVPGSSEQYEGRMAFNFGIVSWTGDNTFVSNIDPKGTVVDASSGITTYSNELIVDRANIIGFDTLDIELNAAKNALPASDYATGGEASDGVYDLVYLGDGAKTDSDTPSITLGGNMPALLAAKQVKTPSADNQVSVQLSELPAQSLSNHPGVTSPNQKGAANLLAASHAQGNTDTQTALSTLTNDEVAPHLDSIHAEPYSSNMTVALEHTDMVMNSVFSQLGRKAFTPNGNKDIKDATPTTRKRMWLDIGNIQGDIEGEDNLGNFDYSLSHLTLGGDIAEFDNSMLGMYFSAGTYDMDEHDSAKVKFSNTAYHLGLYLNQPDIGQWQLRSLLGYAYGDHSSTRQVQLSGSNSNASADYSSHSIYAGIMASTNVYSNDWVALSPSLGLNYVYFKQEGFSEKGGDPSLSLQLDDSDAQAMITSLGLNAIFASISDNYAIYPEAYIRYEHDWYANKNNEHDVSAGLVSNPDYKQDFYGQSRGENAITVGLGLTSDVTSVVQINGGLTATESTHGSEWGASINGSYRW